MNIKQTLTDAYKKLTSTNISSAHLDAELLLSFIIKKSREYILAHPNKNITAKQTKKFNALIKKTGS